MFSKVHEIKRNTYIMQIMTLMSGTLIAQVVMLGFVPIITRLYTPDEFGLYSLYFSIVNIIGLVSSWKYDQAIMLPKSEKDAYALLFLSVLITLAMVCLSILLLLIFNDLVLSYFNGESHLVWMLPFGILLIGLLQIFNAYSSRNQFYSKLATVRVTNSIAVVSIQSLSKYLFKFDGLVLGKLLADSLSLFLLVKFHLKKQTLQLKSLSRRRLRANAKRHDNFPKYQSFTVFFNAITQNMPVLLLASFYSVEIAGLYALTSRILYVPVGLIGSSTKEVYYQRASKMYAAGENIFNLYIKTTLGLLKIFIIPFLVVLLFGEYLFSFIFGEEWRVSGTIAQILILWFLFLFINSPTIITFSILKIQKIQLGLEIFSVLFRFLSICAGYYFYNSYLASIAGFLLSSVIMNIIMIALIYFRLRQTRSE